jgi:hypothetical protein
MFVAKVKPSGKTLMVDFVEQSGAGTHELLAGGGMAHRLLSCGPPDGESDARKVGVMLKAASGLAARTLVPTRTVGKTPALPKDICDKTEEAIKKLHDAQPVFGGLRAPNTMFSGYLL